jgi:hypothetical protein
VAPLAASLLLCTTIKGEEVPNESIRVANLVKDLGDADFATRRGAYQRLAKLGAIPRTELEQSLTHADPEVRLRAGQLLEAIRADELWAPRLITLQATDLPAAEIFKQLAAQAGNHIHVGDPYGQFADARLSVNFVGQQYWQAIDEVCRSTGNRVRPHYDAQSPGMVVSAGSPGDYPRAYSGPVRGLITSAKRHFIEELNYEAGKSELTHSFHLNLQFNWEDRFAIVGYATQPELVEGVTDNAVILSAAQPAGGGWNATSRGLRQVTASLKLNPIPVSAKTLETFTIRWGLIAVGEPKTIELKQFEVDKPHAQDDVVLSIDAIEEPTVGKYILTLNVMRDLALPDPQEILFREYEVELFDQNGTAFRIQNLSPALTDRGVQLRVTFMGDSAESKPGLLKLHYPGLRTKRDVHLTFRNVPLPSEKPE